MIESNKNFLSGKRIVITGGTGFIGSHLLKEIIKHKPKNVLLISRGSKTNRIKEYLSDITLKIYDTSEKYVSLIVNSNPDFLFILGGNADPRLSLTDPRSDFEHNLLYNFNLLEALKNKRNSEIKIIYISSVAVYGESSEGTLSENNLTAPKSPYGINKLATEGYIRFFYEVFGIRGFSIRLFSTYGPQLYKQVVFDFIKALIDNPQSLVIKGDGSEKRDLSYIDDQIRGILLLARKASYKGEVYNLGSGVGLSITDLAKKISKLMNIQPRIIYKKEKKEKHHGHIWIANISKVKKLQHSPKTSIDEGLKRTISWIQKL